MGFGEVYGVNLFVVWGSVKCDMVLISVLIVWWFVIIDMGSLVCWVLFVVWGLIVVSSVLFGILGNCLCICLVIELFVIRMVLM